MNHQILVIDDSKSIYHAITRVLGPRDCIVDYASNGQAGLLYAKNKHYDLILLDIHMPLINGLEVCRALKNNAKYEHRPIILLTSDASNLEEGLMAGASDYILKPFKDAELVARVFAQIKVSKIRLTLKFRTEQLQRDLLTQQTKLKELEQDLQKYFYQASHKLRSPLNSIKGLFHLMKMEYPLSINNQYYPLIDKSIERMVYVNEQVSRIGFLKSCRPSYGNFSLKQILEKVSQSKHVPVVMDEDITLFTDDVIFTYAIEPIVENARYYSQNYKQNIAEASISFHCKNGKSLLVIQDNGPGIRESSINNIFDMFYIGDEKSTGNGLGLFISKLATNLLNLPIDVESRKDQYTKITIDLTQTISNTLTNHELQIKSA